MLPGDLHAVMHSSIDLALGAGRSTIHIISEPVDVQRGNLVRRGCVSELLD